MMNTSLVHSDRLSSVPLRCLCGGLWLCCGLLPQGFLGVVPLSKNSGPYSDVCGSKLNLQARGESVKCQLPGTSHILRAESGSVRRSEYLSSGVCEDS